MNSWFTELRSSDGNWVLYSVDIYYVIIKYITKKSCNQLLAHNMTYMPSGAMFTLFYLAKSHP